MIVCIQSPSRLLMMQDHRSLTRRWLSCSGWGKERVTLVFGYKGGWLIWKGQWCAKVNIVRLTLGYLNATINRKTWNTQPEIRPDRSSQTRQNPRVDGYRSGLDPTRLCRSGFWTVEEPNQTIFPVRTWTAGGLPGPVIYTTVDAEFKVVATLTLTILQIIVAKLRVWVYAIAQLLDSARCNA